MNIENLTLEPDFDYITMANVAFNITYRFNKFNKQDGFNWDQLWEKHKFIQVVLVKRIYQLEIKTPEIFHKHYKEVYKQEGWKCEETKTKIAKWNHLQKWNPLIRDWEDLKPLEKIQFEIFLFTVLEMLDMFMEG